MRDKGLRFEVWVVVVFGALTWFLALSDTDFLGKNPREEETVVTHEKDLRTGTEYDVQLTRCRKCGQVISWIRFNRLGVPVGGQIYHHHECGRVDKKGPYTGAGTVRGFHPLAALEAWQKRWSQQLK